MRTRARKEAAAAWLSYRFWASVHLPACQPDLRLYLLACLPDPHILYCYQVGSNNPWLASSEFPSAAEAATAASWWQTEGV